MQSIARARNYGLCPSLCRLVSQGASPLAKPVDKSPPAAEDQGETEAQFQSWVQDVSDLGEISRKDGKVLPTSERLIAARHAKSWPPLAVSSRIHGDLSFRKPPDGVHAQLVMAAFRAGAEQYLHAWRDAFALPFASNPAASLCEVSIVDMSLLKIWPFKGMLVNNVASETARSVGHRMPTQYLYYFGALGELIDQLGMSNRLTGYVYLLDSEGRIRWHASGKPTEEDKAALAAATTELLSAQAIPRGSRQAHSFTQA